jgi:diguanylate cyclase (GGDEF)-like protein/PAS domain S-box-containing protein
MRPNASRGTSKPRSSRSLENLLDALPCLVAYWDRTLTCGFANRAYQRWHGRTPEAIVGASLRDLLDADHFALNEPHIAAVLRGEPQTFERKLVRADGSVEYTLVDYIADEAEGGEIGGFYVMVNDVTALKRIEAQLRQREASLAELLAIRIEADAWREMGEQIAGIGHWRLNTRDQALTWSDEIYRIHGVSPVNFSPTLEGAIDFYHPDDRENVLYAVDQAIKKGDPFELKVRIIRPGGEVRHVRSLGKTVMGRDGASDTMIGVLIDMTAHYEIEHALIAANRRLDEIAYTDGLTGIANRRRFDEAFEREWRAAARSGTYLSIIMIDVDLFKSYNDLYGHPAGDECLRQVARAIRSVGQRPYDLVARYGGEEMVMLLPSTNAEGARQLGERAREAILALGIGHEGNTGHGNLLTVSMGIATAHPITPCTVESRHALVADADALLYEAKRRGRNRVVSPAELAAQQASVPADEAARLAALACYEQAHATRRSEDLDRIARMAATLTGSPIGLVSLVGRDEQYFAGNFGLDGVDKTSRDVSFCAHTIQGSAPLIVSDASKDARFKDNALVTGDLGLRYYLGAPIVSERSGHRLGAVCALDQASHAETSAAQRAIMSELAKLAAMVLDDAANSPPPL